MATAPDQPTSTLISTNPITQRSSPYGGISKADQGNPAALRESIYSDSPGQLQYFLAPDWSSYISGIADGAYDPIINIDPGSLTSDMLNISARGWTQTCLFTPTDTDTVSWGAGTFTDAAGNSYAISAGNTGNMGAKTYVYLDILTSTISYQLTTNPITAIGDGKVFIAVCRPNATEATFTVFNNDNANIDANNIVANTLSVISANLGTITAGSMSAITITGGTITGTVLKTDTSPNARVELDSVNGVRVYNSANALVAQLTQTLVSGSYFVVTDANVTSALRTNSIISSSGSGNPISINAGTGATFGGSAELIIDGSAVVGKHQFKADGVVRVTINPSGLTINSGTITGNLSGNVTGNVTGNLTGDSTGTHNGAVAGSSSIHGLFVEASSYLQSDTGDVYLNPSADASHSMFKASGTVIKARKSDNSGYASFEAGDITSSGTVSCSTITAGSTSFGGITGTFNPTLATSVTFVDGILFAFS